MELINIFKTNVYSKTNSINAKKLSIKHFLTIFSNSILPIIIFAVIIIYQKLFNNLNYITMFILIAIFIMILVIKTHQIILKMVHIELNESLKKIVIKTNEICDGNFSSALIGITNKDQLSQTFDKMLEYIKLHIDENQKKDLIKTGVAELNHCMRSAETIEDLTDSIIQFIVKNININVGAMFILNEENVFTLSSCYGFNMPEKKDLYDFVSGEGIIGQSIVEKNVLILKDVPSNYLKIKSGLGECHPKQIMIIPIIREDKSIAVIELGSLEIFSDLQITFLKEISQNVGVAISSINSKKKLKELYLESQNQQLALQRSNEELEQYAHVISHDLKEPLRGITGYLEFLKEDFISQLAPEAITLINNTINESSRLNDMIGAVLSYAKVALDGDSFSNVNSSAVLAEALHNLETTIIERNAIITHDPLPDIFGDRGQFVQLYQNLIGNAIKYCENEVPRVHISALREGDNFLFSFKDNGIGMRESQTKRIFIIFERLHNKETYPGTGIGLSICKKIVERHKGRIWVDSVEGKGSIFYFTIPLNKTMT